MFNNQVFPLVTFDKTNVKLGFKKALPIRHKEKITERKTRRQLRLMSEVCRQEVWLRCVYLNLKESRAKGRPFVDDLQEHQFGLFP